MDMHARRGYLATAENPQPHLDYLVSFSGVLGTVAQVEVRYVPDRLILTPGSFAGYLVALGGLNWRHLEEAAAAILGDLNNELVARWVHVTLSRGDGTGEIRHQVIFEDRQPKWENAGLLSRINAR